jgi:hypothetical protein
VNDDLAYVLSRASDALAVLTRTPEVRAFLVANDPQALGQAEDAAVLLRLALDEDIEALAAAVNFAVEQAKARS